MPLDVRILLEQRLLDRIGSGAPPRAGHQTPHAEASCDAQPSVQSVAAQSPRSCPGPDGRPTNTFERFGRAELESSIPARFERQVARHGGRLAIKFDTQEMSYSALDRAANRIAHSLLECLGPANEPVALLLPQGIQQVTAVLGAMKAGKVYVPLDPAHPIGRLTDAIADAGARCVLTAAPYAGLTRRVAGGATVLEVEAADRRPGASDASPGLLVSPDAGAYIFYTSGSTGRPKGVLDTHRNVLHNVMRYTNTLHLCVNDRLSLLQGPSFSGAVSSLFGALLNGGAVFPFDVARDGPHRIVPWLAEEAITVYHSVPALFRQVAPYGASLPALRLVRLEGDQASVRDLELFRTHWASDCVLVNGLGATECGLVRQYFFTLKSPLPERVAPVGEPVEDMEIVLLDEAGRRALTGEVGEIAVRSPFLAAGYWRQPELTAARFLSDTVTPASRIYRTGDFGRLQPNGLLEHLGRQADLDRVRGQQVDIATVEATLLAQPGVAEALAVIREDKPGEPRLVAYLVPGVAPLPTVSALRRALVERLPEFMMPSAFVVLEQFPLTDNLKVDRRALPAPGSIRPMLDTALVLSTSPLEAAVANIWADFLRVIPIGVHDDFFDLGGDSLMAASAITRIAEEFGVRISWREFFDAPTVGAVAIHIAQHLADGRFAAAKVAHPGASESDATVGRPLSFAQQRLWFLDQVLPERAAYNIPAAWRLQGRLDVPALQCALDTLVARHEPLRTRFDVSNSEPVQIIDPPHALELLFTDISATAQAEREARTRQIGDAHVRQPFDLQSGPVMRAQLLRLATDEHLLLLSVHHIACDGWSMGILERELSQAYDAFAAGREPQLPVLAIQYADYAAWQRDRLHGEMFERQISYWKKQLADLPILELSGDRARPPMPSYRGGRTAFDLPTTLVHGLKALGRRESATLFMTLLAGFQVLLYRYSAQEDIAVGTPIAGRGRTELEGLIGFFVNTLVLRGDLSANPRFCDLLTRVRTSALDAYAHQEVPFERLVEELKVARDVSRNPLFQVMFALQNSPGEGLALHGMEATAHDLNTTTAKFDLTLTFTEGLAGLHGELEYASDLFDASTIERMGGHLTTLLEGVVANPQSPIGELPLLTPAERHQILVQWNDTAVDYPRDRCIHQLFEEQVARTPDAVALVFEEQRLTYGELNARANQLAHHLITLGVGPDVPVAICMERSIELIVGVLGILKAGGAYVPLDPGYPKERLVFMLDDTAAPVLLTQQTLVAQLLPFAGKLVRLPLESNAPAVSGLSVQPSGTNADSLAYIIYTSGSTGQPKGVAVPHRGVLRLVFGTDYVRFGVQQRFLLLSSISFDAFTFELWGALLHGSLCVVMPDRLPGVDALRQALRQQRVNTLWLTASLFNLVIDEDPNTLDGVSQLITGGEALSVTHVHRALERLPDLELVNGYGPTESTTFACCHHIARPVSASVQSIPIGRPIANTRAYVLDRHGQPCPIGVGGELHLGGAGLARGYLNRPELTAARFVPDPFSSVSDARMYRTGDRARYLPDGNIEFLGRNDEQVKVRGFRIEPGEIEAVLAAHPSVRQAVVVAREDRPGDKRLIAYIVAQGEAPTSDALRAALKQRLPDYMVPTAFVGLPALPLMANGKIDRAALPRPLRSPMDSAKGHVPARDHVEQTLCQLWAKFLGVEQVGIDDNFFDAGGHSLLAAQLFIRLDRAFGRALPLATLFKTPTVRELARFYRDGAEPAPGQALVVITAGGSLPPVFAVPGVGGNVLGFSTLARKLGPEQTFFGLQSIGLDGLREPLDNVEQMATQYLREVRQAQAQGPYYLLGACFGAMVAFEMTRQLLDAGEQVAFLGLLDPATLQGDLTHQPQRLSAWLRHVVAFGGFFGSRLNLYREQMQAMRLGQKLQFIRNKLRAVRDAMEQRDLFRGDRREFHQRRVSDANLRALLRYHPNPLAHGVATIEIFGTTRDTDQATSSSVDWQRLASGSAPVHKMPGKDSGDMLSGQYSHVIAAHLAVRLALARKG